MTYNLHPKTIDEAVIAITQYEAEMSEWRAAWLLARKRVTIEGEPWPDRNDDTKPVGIIAGTTMVLELLREVIKARGHYTMTITVPQNQTKETR